MGTLAGKFFGPVGAVNVNLDNCSVTCRNGLTGAYSVFFTDFETATKLMFWLKQGKKTAIQDVAPSLDTNHRKMCISGISPELWDKYVGS